MRSVSQGLFLMLLWVGSMGVSGAVGPVYETSFEEGEGVELGSVEGQQGWSVLQGSARVVTFAGARSGERVLSLDAGVVDARARLALSGVGAAGVVFTDFWMRPAAVEVTGEGEDFREFAEAEGALVGLLRVGSNGRLYLLDGEEWVPSDRVLELSGGVASQWQRFTVRQDFGAMLWELYWNGELMARDFGMTPEAAAGFGQFSVRGSGWVTSYVDDVRVGLGHPLYGPNPVEGLGGVQLWLSGREGLGMRVEGQERVSLWLDRSAHGRHAEQGQEGAQPVRVGGSAGVGGHAVVRFDGVDDVLSVASAAGLDVGAADSRTWVVLVRYPGGGVNPKSFLSKGDVWSGVGYAASTWTESATGSPGFHVKSAGVGVDAYQWPHAEREVPVLLTWVLDRAAGTLKGYQGGQLRVTQSISGLGSLENAGALQIGRQGSLHFSGDMAELLIFDRALGLEERVLVEGWLSQEYGLSYASDHDADGWDDYWEILTFGSLAQSPWSDYSGDGIPNQVVLAHGGDPTQRVETGAEGYVLRQLWTGIGGWAVSDLTTHRHYPQAPHATTPLPSLDAPRDLADNYGQRLVGYLHAPFSGAYTFWIAGDDHAELWLSPDNDPAHKVKIAFVDGWTNPEQWHKYPSQQSAPIMLQAGQRYALEVLHKEAGGGDHLSVAWQMPHDTQPRLIGSRYLSTRLGDFPIPHVPPPAFADSDGDHWNDPWEQATFGTLAQSPWSDHSGDGIPNQLHLNQGRTPTEALLLPVDGKARRQLWLHLGGSSVAALTQDSRYPDQPDSTDTLDQLDAPRNLGDNYGQRLSTTLIPPFSGAYTFWIASDDASELWLSSDNDPAHKVKIAFVDGWTDPEQWDKYASQQSAPIMLQAGQRYALEVLHKEGGGGDHLSVAWERPGDPQRRLIDARNLTLTPPPQALGYATREIWFDIASVAALTADHRYPFAPDHSESTLTLDLPISQHRTYAERLSGYLHAPQDGPYTFSPQGTAVRLRLSTDENPAHLQDIGAQSVTLQQGQRYYFELEDYVGTATPTTPLGLRWTLPGGSTPTVIASEYLSPAPRLSGDLLHEVWWNVAGWDIADLLNDPRYPDHPDHRQYLPTLDTPRNLDDFYGSRLQAWVLPPVSGYYTFHLASDDQSRLYLATDGDLSHKTPVASVSGWTGWYEWNKYPDQTSAPVYLHAGQAVYLEVLHKEGVLGDHVMAAWTPPGDTQPRLLGRTVLGAYLPDDRDRDGLPDWWELQYGLDPDNPHDAHADPDQDGLSNLEEYRLATHPHLPDTDADGANDFVEVIAGTDPKNPEESPTIMIPWQGNDIGLAEPALYGMNGPRVALSVKGQGVGDPWDGGDQIAFLSREVTGDFEIVARVSDTPLSQNQFGLMARDGLDTQTGFVAIEASGSMRYRMNLDSALMRDGYQRVPHGLVMLKRTGNRFETRVYEEDKVWRTTSSKVLSLPKKLQVGLFAGGYTRECPTVFHDLSLRVDRDADGLFDDEEGMFGTLMDDADSDGDGRSDFDELYVYHTNPLIAENVTENHSGSLSDFTVHVLSGNWSVATDGSLVPTSENGTIGINVNFPENGMYALDIDFIPQLRQSDILPYRMSVSIDGCYLQDIVCFPFDRSVVTKRIITPWMSSGVHELKIDVKNTMTFRMVRITDVRVSLLGGDDVNGNNIPDWMEGRISLLNSVDNVAVNSRVSPACIEGATPFLPMLSISGGNEAFPGPADRWYANIVLNSGSTTDLVVSFENGVKQEVVSIDWQETNIIDEHGIALNIRAGDTLLLNAYPPGVTTGSGVIVCGSENFHVTPDSPVPVRFTVSGSHEVTAIYEGAVTGTIQVNVFEATFGAPLLFERETFFEWTATGVPSAVTIESDARMGYFSRRESAQGASIFAMLIIGDLDYYLLARVPDNGAVLDSVKLPSFFLGASEHTSLHTVSINEDGSKLVEMPFLLDVIPSDLRIEVRITFGGTTFSDGSVFKVLTSDDFNSEKKAIVTFIVPPGEDAICHQVDIFSGDVRTGGY